MAAGRPRLGFSTVASTRPSRSSRPRWRRTPTELILSRSARRGADRRPWRRNSTRICSRVLGTRSAVDMGLLLPCTLWKQQCFLGIVYAGGGRESKLATLAPPGGTGMAEPLFRGVGVALATLFDDAGGLDAKATAEHAATLVDLGVRAVVVAGSTGEAATLTPAERLALLTEVRRAVPSGIPVLADHYPKSSQPGIPVELLPELPIQGAKDSSGDPERLLAELAGFDGWLYVGASSILTMAGALGCTGAILAVASVRLLARLTSANARSPGLSRAARCGTCRTVRPRAPSAREGSPGVRPSAP